MDCSVALPGVRGFFFVADQRKRQAQLFHETRPLTGLLIPDILYPLIYRRCPESYASTLATTSVAFGRGRVEGESVYQPSEGDLAEAEAILVKHGEMPTMGKEPAQS